MGLKKDGAAGITRTEPGNDVGTAGPHILIIGLKTLFIQVSSDLVGQLDFTAGFIGNGILGIDTGYGNEFTE
jgi:hypothetical protein